MLKVLWLSVITILLLSTYGLAVEFGTDLLNGDGSFEFAGENGPWTLYADSGESSAIVSGSVTGSSYVWKAGPAVSSSKNFRAIYSGIPVLGNRQYRVVYYYSIAGSSPSWIKVNINGVWSNSYTMYWSGGLQKSFDYKTDLDETTATLTLAMYSNSSNDTALIDDVTFLRERVQPVVGNDSVNNTIVNGKTVNVVFNTMIMPGAGDVYPGIIEGSSANIAFDPDIDITAANATVSNIQWVSDYEVSADITPSEVGTVTLVFENVYSNYTYSYDMDSVAQPIACGEAGTQYLASDINHDCKVTLVDFAILGGQWMQCTDMDADPVNCGL
ncbi:MAG: hypothetical protein ACIAQZ_00405 [Sedimentisphaeraceae bacterium JB056]